MCDAVDCGGSSPSHFAWNPHIPAKLNTPFSKVAHIRKFPQPQRGDMCIEKRSKEK